MTKDEQIAAMKALTQGAAAWLVDRATRTFRDAGAPKNADGTYDASEVVKWVRATCKPEVASDDPLMSGSDSPALERYRAARADLAEMDAKERRKQLVDVDQFTEWYASNVGHPIRKAIELLQIRFGADAAAIIVKAIEKADTAVSGGE